MNPDLFNKLSLHILDNDSTMQMEIESQEQKTNHSSVKESTYSNDAKKKVQCFWKENKSQNKQNETQNHNITEHSKESTKPSEQNKQNSGLREQIINVKKNCAKRIAEIQQNKKQEIQSLNTKFQKQREQMLEQFQRKLKEKQQYIKILESLLSQDKPLSPQKRNQSNENEGHWKANYTGNCQKRMYMHQEPLFNQLCYSIKRPHANHTNHGNYGNEKNSFVSTQQMKRTKPFSNEKDVGESRYQTIRNVYQSKRNSIHVTSLSKSKQKSKSKHILMPACRPKY